MPQPSKPRFPPKDRRCLMRTRKCPVHGFVHGKEAEELRVGIEKIIEDASMYGPVSDLLDDLRTMIDGVDARDSLAFLEGHPRKAGG